jgi:hypothetical protein
MSGTQLLSTSLQQQIALLQPHEQQILWPHPAKRLQMQLALAMCWGCLQLQPGEDVQQAVLMTPTQLREWYMELFRGVAPLLELSRRSSAAATDAAGKEAPCCHAAAANASMDTEAERDDVVVQHACGQSRGCSSRRCAVAAAVGAAAAGCACKAAATAGDANPAAAAAAAGLGCEVCEYAAGIQTTIQAAVAELESSIDSSVRLSTLMMLHNPVVVYTIASTNLATGQAAVAPPHHWLLVSEIFHEQMKKQGNEFLRAFLLGVHMVFISSGVVCGKSGYV